MLWAIIKGGPVMIPIILGSIVGLAIIIDKLWMLFRIRMDYDAFTSELFSKARAGNFTQALEICSRYGRFPLAATLRAGLEKRHLEGHELEKVLERVGSAQIKNLERYMGGLVSVIGVEPLLGFLGTITGLIRAFMAWENAGSSITVSVLAGGIYEAMITTAAGLMIAAPYYLVCNFIISRIKYISFELNDASMRLAEILSEGKGRT